MKNKKSELKINIKEFYLNYPQKVIRRPGYPARAAYKSWLLLNLYGNIVQKELGEVKRYADIGGRFGFGANALSYHISKNQKKPPETSVFEISEDFLKIGKQLFPTINFYSKSFESLESRPTIYDLVSLFDIVEHLPDPKPLLKAVAFKSKFVLLKTPLQTSGEWFGSKPQKIQGMNHPDGHVQFFSKETYEKLLLECGLEIIKSKTVNSIVPYEGRDVLIPERDYKYPKLIYLLYSILPNYFIRKIRGGGDHLALCKSKILK